MKTVYHTIFKHNVAFHIGQKASDHFKMLDNAKSSDLWFHLDNYPSCHIIASVPECVSREQIKRIIKHGIRLSKEHSRHGQDVNVIYRRVYLVSKGEKEGEVILNM